METIGPDPIAPEQLIRLDRQVVLPTHDTLLNLKAEGKPRVRVVRLAQRLVHPFGGVPVHRGHPVGAVVKSELYAGVSSEVLSVLPMRARVSRIVKGLCLC